MVRDIAIDPSGASDQVIYLATDSGGVWKTVDGGATWSPLTDFMPSLNIGAVALDPGNPSIVYAGTGNAVNQFASTGAGIYKSIDGGQRWTVLGGTIFTNLSINRIGLPAPNLILVASSSGVFRSMDGGANFGNNPPLYNNGRAVIGGNITDLDVDTASATTVYASISGLGVFKSTDSGATFPLSGNLFTGNNGSPVAPGYITFAQSTRPDNRSMYVQAQLSSGPANAGMFKSVDGGANWSQISINTSDIEIGEVGYAQTIGVDPQDANRVFIGARALYLATDGGAGGITSANRIDLSKVHADQHALVFSPASHFNGPAPTRVYNGTDGGIATTANPGSTATWTLLNGSATCSSGNGSIATVLFRQIDIGRGSLANNAYTYGAAQDLGVSSHQANCPGTPWLSGSGGDGNSIAVDPLNPQHALVALGGGLENTTDGGQSWQLNNAGLPAPPAAPAPSLLYFDPNGGKAYAVNGAQLYQSTDNGGSFTLINTFPATIKALSIAPIDSNSLWVGLSDGTVQRTANVQAGAGAAWAAHTIPNSPSVGVSGLAVDPANTDQAVVVYRSSSQNVFRTLDNGSKWTMLSGNLPGVLLNAVVIDPNTTPHAIIVATDRGVMRTSDPGATWGPLGFGLPNVHCTSLAIDATIVPSLLRVGTFGRSVFELAYDRIYVDWRNNDSQDGTPQHPFHTVLQGLNAPASGAARYINIQAGDYPEGPITLSQCGTLNAINGLATIH